MNQRLRALHKSHPWKRVAAHPWVGDRYDHPDVLPGRTFLLGESHYCDQLSEYAADITIRCTESHIHKQEKSNQFWTRMRRVILGPETKVTPEVFWRSVAFYNFIQFSVGRTARIRPEPHMWADSIPAFDEVLDELRPEYVLVLGATLWGALAAHIPMSEEKDGVWSLLHNGQRTSIGYINHPSSFGFSYARWHPEAARVLGIDRLPGE